MRDELRGKQPIIVDVNTNLVATFVSLEDDSAEAEFVRFKYVPFNEFIPRPRITPYSIRKNLLQTFRVANKNIVGQELELMIVMPDGSESNAFNQQALGKYTKEIKELQQRVEQLKKANTSLKAENNALSGSQAESVKRLQDAKGKQSDTPVNPYAPTGFRGF